MEKHFRVSSHFRLITVLLSFLSIFEISCGSREPVATEYKKALANGDFGPGSQSPTIPSLGDDDAIVGNQNGGDDDFASDSDNDSSGSNSIGAGEAIFKSTCGGCHGAGATPGQGPVAGASETRILSVKNQSQHSGAASNWPSSQEAKDLAAYLDTL